MKNNKKIWYDEKADILFIGKEGIEEKFEEILPGVHIEYDNKENIIGVEILHASKLLSPAIKQIYKKSQVA